MEGPSPYGDARTERVRVFSSLYDYTGKRFITKNEFSLILFINKMMNKHTKSVIDHALTIFCVNPLAATVPYMGRFCYHMPMQKNVFFYCHNDFFSHVYQINVEYIWTNIYMMTFYSEVYLIDVFNLKTHILKKKIKRLIRHLES